MAEKPCGELPVHPWESQTAPELSPGPSLAAYGWRLAAYFTVTVNFIPSATCGMQYPLYVPAGAPANETSYFSFGCVRKGPVRSPIWLGIAFFSTSAPPFGTESAKNATLCGPPDTSMNRTVVPGLMVTVAGSNAAWVVPLPVIF